VGATLLPSHNSTAFGPTDPVDTVGRPRLAASRLEIESELTGSATADMTSVCLPVKRTHRRREQKCPELRSLVDDASGGVHSIEFGSKGEPSETTVQPVLRTPGGALVVELKAVPVPGMADEVMDGTKTIKGAPELTVEERMKPFAGRRG